VTISSWARRARTDATRAAILALLASCGGARGAAVVPGVDGPAPLVSAPTLAQPVDFVFDSLDTRPVSAEATRGKPTVITFVTTASLPAQAQVDFLVAMARHDAERINYAVVALEPREDRELVELYEHALKMPFPAAMADPQTLAGAGPFGDVGAVPITVILDRAGRVVWRVEGRVAKSDEIRAALRGL
jgi:hypothetical protein